MAFTQDSMAWLAIGMGASRKDTPSFAGLPASVAGYADPPPEHGHAGTHDQQQRQLPS